MDSDSNFTELFLQKTGAFQRWVWVSTAGTFATDVLTKPWGNIEPVEKKEGTGTLPACGGFQPTSKTRLASCGKSKSVSMVSDWLLQPTAPENSVCFGVPSHRHAPDCVRLAESLCRPSVRQLVMGKVHGLTWFDQVVTGVLVRKCLYCWGRRGGERTNWLWMGKGPECISWRYRYSGAGKQVRGTVKSPFSLLLLHAHSPPSLTPLYEFCRKKKKEKQSVILWVGQYYKCLCL